MPLNLNKVGRNFEDLLTEAWFKLEDLRRETRNEPMFKWQKLSELTSEAGVICGLRVYVKGLFGRKSLVEIHLAYDRSEDCYRVSTWRKGFERKEVFPGKNSDDRPTIEQAVAEIGRMIDVIS